jgi:hypothetical protein
MPPQKATISVISMTIWLLVQIGALALAAFRWQLAITMPRATEQSALAMMLIAQVSCASLLFPFIMRNCKLVIISVVSAWPMAQLAAMLAEVPPPRWIYAEAFVSFWLITLAVWTWALPKPRIFLTAIAAMFTLGGPILWYLRSEFTTSNFQVDWRRDIFFTPIFGALSQIFLTNPTPLAWLTPAFLFVLAITFRIFGTQRAKKIIVNLSDRTIL